MSTVDVNHSHSGLGTVAQEMMQEIIPTAGMPAVCKFKAVLVHSSILPELLTTIRLPINKASA